jgi:hypothetical protein
MGKAWIFAAFFALLLFAGCTGGGKGGGEAGLPGGIGEEVSEKVREEIETATDEEWCVRGAYWQWMNPQTGESAQLVVQGIVDHEGRKTCKAVLEGRSAGEYARWEGYFSRNGEYTHMLFYDEQDRLRLEWKMEEGRVTIRQYDEQGNLVGEYTMGEGMPMPGMGGMPIPMPGQ